MSSSFTHSYDHSLPFLASQQVQDTPYPPPFYISDERLNSEGDVIKPLDQDGIPVSNGSFLPPPPPTGTQDESFAVREWRRQNAVQLEEKEKMEKEFLNIIINVAEEYKVEFYRMRQATLETGKAACREKEKLFLTSHEKFHSEADKHFWKAIAELIPNEAPTSEKKNVNKDEEKKKPIITTIQGPKPGIPTDLSRMRQILLKLKQNAPVHLNTSPPAAQCKT